MRSALCSGPQVGEISEYESSALKAMMPELQESIAKGVAFVKSG